MVIVAGPGTYGAEGSLGKAPAYSISGRPATAPVSRSPGPGAYPHLSILLVIYLIPAYVLSGSFPLWKGTRVLIEWSHRNEA